MSQLDLNALNELPKVDRVLALAETNAQLETLTAEERVASGAGKSARRIRALLKLWHPGGGEPAQ